MDMYTIPWDDDTNTLLPQEELLESCLQAYYESTSSPDGAQGSSSKNIVSERNRRHKLNEKLFALRSVVPNITKLDKASIIKDAIAYIKSLQDEERKIKSEMWELESSSSKNEIFKLDQEAHDHQIFTKPIKRSRLMDQYHSLPSSSTFSIPPSHPIELLELRVLSMGERIIEVSLACSKRSSDTMVKLCEMFECLNLKITSAHITAFSERLLSTVFLEGDEQEREVLSFKIRTAISALNDPDSPMSI